MIATSLPKLGPIKLIIPMPPKLWEVPFTVMLKALVVDYSTTSKVTLKPIKTQSMPFDPFNKLWAMLGCNGGFLMLNHANEEEDGTVMAIIERNNQLRDAIEHICLQELSDEEDSTVSHLTRGERHFNLHTSRKIIYWMFCKGKRRERNPYQHRT